MIIVLALVAYVPALRRGHCIYRIWPSGRVEAAGDETTLATGDKVEMLQPRGLGSTLGYALLFSLISAFQIGWRELNVGNWIARLARFEYVLKPVGWTRTIAGIQSLVSLYLVAIWALTYFGRPFQ
jgi:hypothetical protein